MCACTFLFTFLCVCEFNVVDEIVDNDFPRKRGTVRSCMHNVCEGKYKIARKHERYASTHNYIRCTCTQTHSHSHTHARAQPDTYTHTHAQTHTHAHTHTRIHAHTHIMARMIKYRGTRSK